MVLEKTLESPLDCKEIQPVHPKGDQSWVSIGRTDVEAETPILWPPNVESWLIWKDPDAGKDWGQEEKGMTEDDMVGWHHQHNGHGFGQIPGVGDGQERLACCCSWGRRVGHDWVTELNWVCKDCLAINVIVQSPSHVWLLTTPWTPGHQASLSLTISEFTQLHVRWVSDAIHNGKNLC